MAAIFPPSTRVSAPPAQGNPNSDNPITAPGIVTRSMAFIHNHLETIYAVAGYVPRLFALIAICYTAVVVLPKLLLSLTFSASSLNTLTTAGGALLVVLAACGLEYCSIMQLGRNEPNSLQRSLPDIFGVALEKAANAVAIYDAMKEAQD